MIAKLTGLLTAGDGSTSSQPPLPANQPGSFAIDEIESKDTSEGTLKTWRATSRGSKGQPFVFRLEVLLKTPKANSSFMISKGAIVRERGADGRHFLSDVARAIESEVDAPIHAEKVDRVDFSVAILGTSLSLHSGDDVIAGRFTSSKPGNWMVFKLFLADGEGEVFFNIDPVLGQGEFSTKDPEYGEVVLGELAKVFLP